jgi:hypothetical protein
MLPDFSPTAFGRRTRNGPEPIRHDDESAPGHPKCGYPREGWNSDVIDVTEASPACAK